MEYEDFKRLMRELKQIMDDTDALIESRKKSGPIKTPAECEEEIRLSNRLREWNTKFDDLRSASEASNN